MGGLVGGLVGGGTLLLRHFKGGGREEGRKGMREEKREVYVSFLL